MTLKTAFFWFWSTLLVGASSIFLFYPFIHISTFSHQLLLGLTLASVTELGFFSYLIFNWLVKSQTQSKKIFSLIQIGLMLVVLLNFTYVIYYQGRVSDYSILMLITTVAVLTSYLKIRWTQKEAFLPTLFFMVVATIIETTPSFHSKSGAIPFMMILETVSVILLCNAWQILQLQRWVKKEKRS